MIRFSAFAEDKTEITIQLVDEQENGPMRTIQILGTQSEKQTGKIAEQIEKALNELMVVVIAKKLVSFKK